MADHWNIGCSKYLQHEIKTTIRIKLQRQPAHLEEETDEALKNLSGNVIRYAIHRYFVYGGQKEKM